MIGFVTQGPIARKRAAPPGQKALDGLDPRLEFLRDLGVREALEMAQHDGAPLPVG
jgi:hypothetical protein